MNISQAKWQDADETALDATIDGKAISGIRAGSQFWRRVQDWIGDGNTPAPADPPPPPPSADERIDRAGDIFTAFLKAYAAREGLTLAQVRDAIKAQL